MTMQQINTAAASMTALADAFNTKMAGIDAQLASFTASVAAGVRDVMRFVGTVDPDIDESNPNQRIFKTAVEFFDRVPSGADSVMRIPAGKTVSLTQNHNLRAGHLTITNLNSGPRPKLFLQSYLNGNQNAWRLLISEATSAVYVSGVDIEFAPKADPQASVSNLFNAFVRGRQTLGPRGVNIESSTVHYSGPGNEVALTRVLAGEMVHIGVSNMTFSGVNPVIANGNNRFSLLGGGVTLQGGAALARETAEPRAVIDRNTDARFLAFSINNLTEIT